MIKIDVLITNECIFEMLLLMARCGSILISGESNRQCPNTAQPGRDFCLIHSRYSNPERFHTSDKEFATEVIKDVYKITSELFKTFDNIKPNPIAFNTSDLSSHLEIDTKEDDDKLIVKKIMIKNIPPSVKYNYPSRKEIDLTTLSNRYDPITCEEFWTETEDGHRDMVMSPNLIFAYRDEENKLCGLNIFSLKSIMDSESIKSFNMKKSDETRAGIYILYMHKYYNLFDSQASSCGAKTIELFGKFHKHSIYLDPRWFDNLQEMEDIKKFAKVLCNCIAQNIDSFKKKKHLLISLATVKKNQTASEFKSKILDFMIKTEKTLDIYHQTFAWVIAYALSDVCNEVIEKYPHINNMFE